jgi:hypothetical protein
MYYFAYLAVLPSSFLEVNPFGALERNGVPPPRVCFLVLQKIA